MSDPHDYLAVGIDAFIRKASSPRNLAKPSWKDDSDYDLRMRVIDELNECREAVENGQPEAILDEACDVLAFAAMLVDNLRAKHGAPLVPRTTVRARDHRRLVPPP